MSFEVLTFMFLIILWLWNRNILSWKMKKVILKNFTPKCPRYDPWQRPQRNLRISNFKAYFKRYEQEETSENNYTPYMKENYYFSITESGDQNICSHHHLKNGYSRFNHTSKKCIPNDHKIMEGLISWKHHMLRQPETTRDHYDCKL